MINNYSCLSTPNEATKTVSVIIPVFNRMKTLEKNLTALSWQTYPRELMEIVVADDGSSEDIREMLLSLSLPFKTKHVFQEDNGYRLSANRNNGIRVSSGEVLIILDVDMIPVPKMIFEHMKWHQENHNVLVLGHRRYVEEADVKLDDLKRGSEFLNSVRPTIHKRLGIDRDWREEIYTRTDILKNSSDPWMCVCGGNISMKRSNFFRCGLFDEEFVDWGREDQEFGRRAFVSGNFIVPEMSALALHLEHPVDAEKRTKEFQATHRLFEKKIKNEVVPVQEEEVASTDSMISFFRREGDKIIPC